MCNTPVYSLLVMYYVICAAFRDGIRFAFRESQEGEAQHPNVAFLEILSEFSFKLLQKDRAQL